MSSHLAAHRPTKGKGGRVDASCALSLSSSNTLVFSLQSHDGNITNTNRRSSIGTSTTTSCYCYSKTKRIEWSQEEAKGSRTSNTTETRFGSLVQLVLGSSIRYVFSTVSFSHSYLYTCIKLTKPRPVHSANARIEISLSIILVILSGNVLFSPPTYILSTHYTPSPSYHLQNIFSRFLFISFRQPGTQLYYKGRE